MPPISDRSPDAGDQICIDRKTFKQLLALLTSCVDELVNPRDCEIFLTFLDTYLSENNSPEPRKALLLLNYYRDIVPDALEEVVDRLEEARGIFKSILATSKLGGAMTRAIVYTVDSAVDTMLDSELDNLLDD